MHKTAIFTIASLNYIAYARTLMESVQNCHPDADRFMLLVDEPSSAIDLASETFTVVPVKDLDIDGFDEMAFKYDIMEFNTAVKPFFMSWLLKKGYRYVIYFDPDIMLYSKLDLLIGHLDDHSIVITPHITSPITVDDKCMPGELDFLLAGTYNLGFIAVSNSEQAGDFLAWWSQRCHDECYSETETGYFVDQKWINLVPGLFHSVKILRDPGFNMAYWNLHERYLEAGKVNGTHALVFYHFSGVNPNQSDLLSKYQNRFELIDRPDILEMFAAYQNTLIHNGYNETCKLPYGFDSYDNGEKIGPFARRIFSVSPSCDGSPFSTGPGSYYELLKKKHLLSKPSIPKYTKENTSSLRNKLNVLFICLSMILGGDRYNALMKYLRFSSVVRRQGFVSRGFFS
jgi:hypothetical protein